jgi:hypothetical protein
MRGALVVVLSPVLVLGGCSCGGGGGGDASTDGGLDADAGEVDADGVDSGEEFDADVPDAAPPCTDDYEPNDTASTASMLELAAPDERVMLDATVDRESDFYVFTVPREDPVIAEVSYRIDDPGSTTDLGFRVVTAGGATVARSEEDRTGPSELESDHWNGDPDATYVLEVRSNGRECVPYQLAVVASLCSDADEDNDTVGTAVPITLGASFERTGWLGDDDYYRFDAAADGRVTARVSYSVELGNLVDMSIFVTLAGGRRVTDADNPRSGLMETEEATFNVDMGSTYLIDVFTNGDLGCTPYTFELVMAPPP